MVAIRNFRIFFTDYLTGQTKISWLGANQSDWVIFSKRHKSNFTEALNLLLTNLQKSAAVVLVFGRAFGSS